MPLGKDTLAYASGSSTTVAKRRERRFYVDAVPFAAYLVRCILLHSIVGSYRLLVCCH